MTTPSFSPYPLPTPEEIEAAIRRAHRERARAVGSFFASLFSRRKVASDDTGPQPALGATARC